jgi:hypothetical protein
MTITAKELDIFIKALRCLREKMLSADTDIREVNELLEKLEPVQKRNQEYSQNLEDQENKQKKLDNQLNPQTGGLINKQ